MSPVLPFDIITVIIDIIGENKDTDLLKDLALVSQSFLHICSKHLFSTVELHDTGPAHYLTASNKGFIKLLKSRPSVVEYIRKLTYKTVHGKRFQSPPILPVLLRTIPYLNCLTIATADDWKTLDCSLKSALLHLMHLPTINYIDLSFIRNFPLPSLTSCVHLHRLDIHHLLDAHELKLKDSFEIVQSEMRLREFHISESSLPTMKLLNAKLQDGRPAFNFMDLGRLSLSFVESEDEQIIRYLLQNAQSLEELHLSVDCRRNLVGLLSPSARSGTLKVLDLTVFLYRFCTPPLAGLCEEFEAMSGRNKVEALFFEVKVDAHESEDFIGSVIQKVEEVLVRPGWSALKQVSFKISCLSRANRAKAEALRYLPDEYLRRLSKLQSIAFTYSVDNFMS